MFCMYTTCIFSAHVAQKASIRCPGSELKMVVSHHTGARNGPRSSAQASNALTAEPPLWSLLYHFLIKYFCLVFCISVPALVLPHDSHSARHLLCYPQTSAFKTVIERQFKKCPDRDGTARGTFCLTFQHVPYVHFPSRLCS